MCEQSGTHQQGPFILDEDQNHGFQKHVVLIFRAIVCLSLCPHFSLKGLSFWFMTLREIKLD